MTDPGRTTVIPSDLAAVPPLQEEIGAVVGKAFESQVHTLEQLDSRVSGNTVELDVVVVWTATNLSDGVRRSYRATQSWELDAGAGMLRISRYRVLDMVPIQLAA